MLHIEGLFSYYGKVEALHGVSLTVNEGEAVTLIGANGAGKSTLLRSISRSVTTKGTIEFNGVRIDRVPEEAVVRAGIVHVPEGRKIFPGLTVVENLEVAAYGARKATSAQIRSDIKDVFDLFPGLAERRASYGWSLSGGEQQMLAIGRGLMAKPKLLLLDEPSLGLGPLLVREVFRVINEIRQEGVTLLIAEQNAKAALSLANRGYVMETGRLTQEGKAADLLHDQAILSAYLGEVDEVSSETC